ncbi:hypothetical protein [Lentilactobacillus rapi]|uniref:hypothetical protein n=1 Tax=Lentilactobacillus rapi TaxID=481723 RepID=UPI000B261B6C|nr:hypothetical protein [Lentilactobacillus rapi]
MIIHTHGLSGPQLDEVTNIWLTANLEAHWFIDGNYWRNYYAEVKPQIGDSELFLYEEAKAIQASWVLRTIISPAYLLINGTAGRESVKSSWRRPSARVMS